MHKIRLLLVNEIRLMAHIIATALEEQPDIEVVGLSTNTAEALDLAPQCDVALVSTRLPGTEALDIVRSIAEDYPEVKTLALGLGESEAEILKYVECGARGYVLKDDSVDELLQSIRAVHGGEALVSAEIAAAMMTRVNQLAEQFTEAAKISEAVELTPREHAVLRLIAAELSNQEIAERLTIEVGTVKNHVHSILEKLNVRSRHDAANYWSILEQHDRQAPTMTPGD